MVSREPSSRRGQRTFSTVASTDFGDHVIDTGLGSVGVGEQQAAGAAHLLSRAAEPLHGVLTKRAFPVLEADDTLLLEHGGRPCG